MLIPANFAHAPFAAKVRRSDGLLFKTIKPKVTSLFRH
jgi:hypothetical protein